MITTATTSHRATLAALDFTLDDIAELNPDPGNDTETFFGIIHPPGYHRFTQDLAYDWPKSYWSRTDEFLRMPPATGREQTFVSINPICQRITDKDRANPKFSGRAARWIEQRIASKNRTVAALTALIRDYDAKDFTDPTQAEIITKYEILRADPDKAKSTDNALLNEALGAAKSAKFKTDPDHYRALTLAHVEALDPAPSATVNSGGGINCYWFLDEPFHIRTDEHDQCNHITSYAADVQKRWVHMDARADQGVNDIRRILRPVGTINHKAAYAPNFPTVSFVKTDFDLRHSLADLVALLPAVKAQAPVTTSPTARTTATIAAQDGPPEAYEGDSVIHAYNARHTIKESLLEQGYTEAGDRMARPGGKSPSVTFDEAHPNQSYHHSSSDPLSNGYWRRPFDVFCTYAHRGNTKKAVYAAAVDLGMVKRADLTATLAPIRLRLRQLSFAEFVPPSPDGIYRTDSTDTKIADAILDAMNEDGRLDIVIGKKRLGKLAGTGPNTALRALLRLQNFLFVVTPDPFGARVTFAQNSSFALVGPPQDVVSSLTTGGPTSANEELTGVINEYSPRKATDPFLSGISHKITEDMQKVAATLDITVKEAFAQFTQKGLGETKLRVLDALGRMREATAQELADETGKKLSAIRRACQELERLPLLESAREGKRGPKVYTLVDDVWGRVDALAPHLRTYHLTAERENKRLERTQAWTQAEIEAAGDTAGAEKLKERFERLANERIPLLAQIHDKLPPEAIQRIAYDVAAYKRRPQAPPPAPAPAPRPLPPTRWGFVKDIAGIMADLQLSAQEGANWRKEAYWLASYLDGHQHDPIEAERIAMGMGLYYKYGVDWVGLRADAR